MTEHNTDILFIGAGPGGYVGAIRAAQLGKRVAVVEKSRAGGICLNWGCIPTKALLHAVHTIRLAHEGAQIGLKYAPPERDIARLSAWRTRIVDRLVRGVEYLFKQNNINVLAGVAEFTDARQVKVTAADGTATLVQAEHIVIATGSEPVALPGLEPDGERIVTSNEAILLKTIPGRLLIVGAGAIGLEFASIYAGLGGQVVVVEVMDQVLPGTDPELAGLLERALRKQGIQILLKTRVASIDKSESLRAHLIAADSIPSSLNPSIPALDFDQVLIAVGRRPLTRGLSLEKANVQLDSRGFIRTDKQLQTDQPGVFAIGDVARPPLLAHKASHEGIAVAERIAGLRPPATGLLAAIPNCVFTDPELATVGMTEAEATAAGHETAIGRFPLSALGRAATLNRLEGMCKIVADRKTDKVLGVHILAPEASSLISEGALAVRYGITARDLGSTVHPHPTLGELLMEAAEDVHRQSIHLPPGSSEQ
jgi:dihydrolipoamide dehydrogenase